QGLSYSKNLPCSATFSRVLNNFCPLLHGNQRSLDINIFVLVLFLVCMLLIEVLYSFADRYRVLLELRIFVRYMSYVFFYFLSSCLMANVEALASFPN
ncbi:hypothetical protein S245_041370, partial [Arachis hypogaea]